MKNDLSKLSLEELRKLQKNVAKAIDSFKDRQIAAARAELEARAKELGYSLDQIVGGKGAPRAKVAPKYRNPKDASATWTGRGRKPLWVVAALEKGKKLEDFLIK